MGLVGLSRIGAGRAEVGGPAALGTLVPDSHASAYDFVDATRVVAVCDIVPALIDGFQAAWADVLPNVSGYRDYRDMLDRERLDLVSVVTGDHLHAQIVVDAAQAGVKGIICEKPLATSISDADRMIAAVDRAGIPLMVDHTRRWFPLWVQVAKEIESGAIGDVVRIVAQAGGPRAMWFRNGTHLTDLVVWYAGGAMQAIYALIEEQFRDYGPRYAGDGGRDPGTDPAVSALVEFDSGVRGFINMDKRIPAEFGIQVWGTEGRIVVESDEARVVTLDERLGFQIRPLHYPQFTHAGLAGCVNEMVDLVRNGGQPSSSAIEARKTVEILVGALQSQAAGGVRLRAPISDA